MLAISALLGGPSGREEWEEGQGLGPAVPFPSQVGLGPTVSPHGAQLYRIF